MPKTKISEFSAIPGNNTDIDGINIAEGCPPSGINDAIRELMSQLKDFQAGTAGDSFNGPIGTTTPAAGVFTNLSASGTFALTGDQVQISEGGTGQTTANAAFNALAPSQSTHAGKYLKTDGTNTSWDALDISTADITGTLPIANGGTGLTALGTGVQTALGIAVGSSGAFVTNGGALGTPSSGTVTNLTGTASININGTVGATTPTTGAFTTTTISTSETLSYGTANGVAYLNGSKVLTTGSALQFDGNTLSLSGPVAIFSNNNFYMQFQRGSTVYGYLGTGSNTAGGSVTDLGIRAENNMVFAAGGTEQMRLTSTGLGIGTSSPARKLDVNGSIQIPSNNALYINGSSNYLYADTSAMELASATQIKLVTNGALRATLDSSGNLGLGVTPSAFTSTIKALQIGPTSVFRAGDTGYTQATFVSSNARQASAVDYYIANGYASQYVQQAGAHYWYTAASGTAGNTISFTQAMTLDASGNLLVGKTAENTTTVGIQARADGLFAAMKNDAVSGIFARGNSDGDVVTFRRDATAVGSISVTTTATAYNTSSDYRLKNITGPVTESGAFIDALKPKVGTWKADGSKFVGFIAHEVQEVSPGSVVGTKDAVDEEGKPVYQAMEYGSAEFIANIIAELQSLRARVAQLEAK